MAVFGVMCAHRGSCGNGFEIKPRPGETWPELTEEVMRGQGWRQNFDGLAKGGRFEDGGWYCPSHRSDAEQDIEERVSRDSNP